MYKFVQPVLLVWNWLFLCLMLVLFLLLISCNTDKQTSAAKPKIRLITLSPHLAELVESAGAIENLVGVVAFSDFPESVKNIQQIGDAFKLDYESMATLKPDYILTWKGGTPIAIIERLKSLKLTIVETEISVLSDIPKTLAQIAELTKTEKSAEITIKNFNQKITELKQLNHTTRTAFIETYHQPLYTISGKHWMSEAAAICGYENIFNDLSQLSAAVSLEAVISKNPQAIINIAKQEDKQWQQWQSLDAVKNKHIITISPDLFSRPSMRILQGIEQLCSSG